MVTAGLEDAFGDYVAEAVIGRGAMGTVYCGHRRSDDARVAIKALRSLRPNLVAAFRREAHLLSTLTHPGIVRVLEHGLTRGVPWYAMELIESPTVSAWIYGAGREPVSPTEPVTPSSSTLPPATARLAPSPRNAEAAVPFFRFVVRICEALSFLHSHGIVHRDIKPDNILIKSTDRPILVDFGIVAKFGGSSGREVLEVADLGAGTMAYIAPEQRRGRLVDARADLFSLGCILYQFLTGRLPFGLAGFREGMNPPPPPSQSIPWVPAELDQLVMRLLSADPQDRIGYADDVAAVLAKVAGERQTPPQRPVSYLYRPDFAGRDRLISRLGAALVDARDGRGSKVLLTGESGVGKTRLALELATRAAAYNMMVVTGDSPELETSGPQVPAVPLHAFRGLLLAVADACHSGGPEATARLLGVRARVLAPYEPTLAELPGFADLPELEPLPELASRKRLMEALGRVLIDFARNQPLLLVLDDLQWADDLSVEFLSTFTLPEGEPAPLLVLGLCREEDAESVLSVLTTDAATSRESIQRLENDRAAIRQMVAGMIAIASPPDELIAFLEEVSRGNPFFITEYLRAAIGASVLGRDAYGRWFFDATASAVGLSERVGQPPSVAALVERRLGQLDDLSRRIVSAAAVLGRRFDVDLVAATAGVPPGDVLDAHGRLRQRHILEDEATGTVRFVHDQLREVAYRLMSPSEAAGLHGRAALALEARLARRDPSEANNYLGALGHHHAVSGNTARAAEYFEKAADHARKSFANRDALTFLRLAWKQQPFGDEGREARARIDEATGDLLLLGGSPEEARARFLSALEATPLTEGMERARRHRKVARTWERQHHHLQALELYATAEAELGALPGECSDAQAARWWGERVQIEVDRAWDLYWLARVDDLAALVVRVRPLIARYGSPRQRAQFFQALVHMNLRRDRYAIADETIEYAQTSLLAAEQDGGPAELAMSRFFLAFPLMFRGQHERAEQLLVAALADAERIGDALMQARFLSYYTVLKRRLGRLEEARAMAERARQVAAGGKMFDYVGVAHANLCWVALREGDQKLAETEAAAALAAWKQLPPGYPFPFQWILRLPLGALMVAQGDVEGAIANWRPLLDPGQQRLPDSISTAIESALAQEPGPGRLTEATRVLEAARAHLYL